MWWTLATNFFSPISRELAENAVIAKVNGALWDLDRPLEGDSTVELLMFDNEEAQAVSVWKPELDLYDKELREKPHMEIKGDDAFSLPTFKITTWQLIIANDHL